MFVFVMCQPLRFLKVSSLLVYLSLKINKTVEPGCIRHRLIELARFNTPHRHLLQFVNGRKLLLYSSSTPSKEPNPDILLF